MKQHVDPKQLNNAHSSTDHSIIDELQDLEEHGVTEAFAVLAGARVRCSACDQTSDARTVALLDVRRLEGKSDPSEMAAVLTLRCPNCGAEGACVMGFGPLASAEDQDVLLALSIDERLTGRHSGEGVQHP
ncbi:MAG: hypothetical protein Q8O67_19645 [Deltaproteobacteria bacterium]|nr:hypothetical protein [Deltaproteobacteria bacterium]